MSSTQATPAIRAYIAELVGTFVLVFGGVGTAVISGHHVGNTGIALAFGLALLAMWYAIGPISGCHINPAVTLGLLAVGRISVVKAVGYWVSQLIGGLLAGLVLYAVARNLPEYRRSVDGLGANGYGDHSPSALTDGETGHTFHGYGLSATIIVEVLLTALLVFVVLAATDKIADKILAGVAIGFTLGLIYLISIPVDGASVNPARSVAVAWYQTGAPGQLWAFIVFPLIGGALGAVVYAVIYGRWSALGDDEELPVPA